MATRVAKILLICGVTVYYALVVFNNLTDFGSNYAFVQHVLEMDTTFPGNHGMWRAITSPTVHLIFYLAIIASELAMTVLLAWGAVRLIRAYSAAAEAFNRAKNIAVLALAVSLLLWLVAFLAIGGEWFLMWQSRAWNGEDAAFRMFMIAGVVLLFLVQPERDAQP